MKTISPSLAPDKATKSNSSFSVTCFVQLIGFAEQKITDDEQNDQRTHSQILVLQGDSEHIHGDAPAVSWLTRDTMASPTKEAPFPKMSIRP